MTDIASLGLEIRSDGVVVATDRLGKFRKEAGLAEAAAGSLKRLATMGLAALAAGFAAFGIGIGAAVKRMEEMRKLSAQVDQALKNSGNSARTSAQEIEAWGDRLEARTGRQAEEIMAVSTNLASYGFSRQAFFRSLSLADDMSAAWGGDMKQNLEGLARALAEPEKGLAMLTKRGITFTDEQKKMIAAFVQTNDLAGAQGVVFDALEAQVKGVAEKGYGGLTKALHTAGKAWEDAFEDLVRGDGQASDLRNTIEDLAATLSSPAFIGAVMGFGNMIIQVINGIAQVAMGAAKAFQDLMNLVNAPGGALSNLSASTAPLDTRSIDVMRQQIEANQAMIDRTRAQQQNAAANGGDMGGWFGSSIGANSGVENLIKENDALKAAVAARSNASAVNVNGIVGGLGGQAYDSVEAMRRGLSPGTMDGQTAFNPYEGMTLGGADKDKAAAKAKKAYDELTLSARQFIDEQTLEAQTLGMTEEAASRLRHEQDLLNQAANDNLKLTPKQTAELGALAASMAAAEEQTRRLTEIYDSGKAIFSSFFGDLKSGIEDGNSLWESLGQAASNALDSIANKALEMAANGIWDMIFGSLFGGAGGGAGGGLGGLLGGLFGGGRANGGPVEPGTIYRVNENTPNSEWFMPRTAGTIIPKMPVANQNQSSGPTVQIIDQRQRGTIKQEEGVGPNGEKQLRLIIRDEVQQAQRRGAVGF